MIDERARHELYRAVEDLLGTEHADTLMSLLPPVGWADVATKDDLRQLEGRLDARFTRVDARFAQLESSLDARFAQLESTLDARFSDVDARFAQLESSLDARFSDVDARFAQFDSQLDGRFSRVDARFADVDANAAQLESRVERALREQTRTLMLGLLGALVMMTSLCLGAVALVA
ncbi:MAG: hypothetical protein ACLFXM_02350 [Acidimicrobiia bacterium]